MNTTLSNLQLELLKTFSVNLGEEQLIEIKSLLSDYFAKHATDEMDTLFEENQWGLEKINEWKDGHFHLDQNVNGIGIIDKAKLI